MRMYKVSLNGLGSVPINFRNSIVILKEGDDYNSNSPIYQFFSKYFVPAVHYKPPMVEEIKEEIKETPKKTRKAKTADINTNENDVIIEITNQEKE